MERPKTQAEARKAEFDRTAKAARELGDRALRELDAVLAEEEEIRRGLELGVVTGAVEPEDLVVNLRAWKQARTTNLYTPPTPDIPA